MPSSPSPYFSASYDSTAKIVTALACAVLIAVVALTGMAVVAVLATVTLLLSYAWSPRGYSVAGRSIFVHRLIGKARIPLDAVRELRRASSADFDGCIRLFASGGMFGYYGLFRTSKLGSSHWYLTNRDRAIIVVSGDKTYLVSPDSTDEFLAAVQSSASLAAAPPRPFDGLPACAAGGRGRFVVIGLALVAGAAFSSVALLYSPGPPNYTLTAKSLVIHDRFYPVTLSSSAVDVMRIHVVDLRSDSQWRPVERTNGFANAHYRSGHFRVAGGQTVRLYQARSPRLVLIPALGNGTTVLLETRDPEGFAAHLRREWSGPLISQPPER